MFLPPGGLAGVFFSGVPKLVGKDLPPVILSRAAAKNLGFSGWNARFFAPFGRSE